MCHARNDRKDPGPVAAKSPADLCGTCHDEVRGFGSRQVRHPPVDEACTRCHNPHDAERPGLLSADVAELCTSCHATVRGAIERGAVRHEPVATGGRCVTCHDPHGSSFRRLLRANAFDLCMGCHGKDGVRTSDGRPVRNLAAVLAARPYWHAPVRAKDCTSCHLPHASAIPGLLAAPYPDTFYAPYEPGRYRLCFQCHDEQAFSTPETATLTGFRDGSRNLHHLHVDRKRGRTCGVCHEVHASMQQRLLRESVPYGPIEWKLEVGHKILPAGGSCTRTCHPTEAYRHHRKAGAEAPR